MSGAGTIRVTVDKCSSPRRPAEATNRRSDDEPGCAPEDGYGQGLGLPTPAVAPANCCRRQRMRCEPAPEWHTTAPRTGQSTFDGSSRRQWRYLRHGYCSRSVRLADGGSHPMAREPGRLLCVTRHTRGEAEAVGVLEDTSTVSDVGLTCAGRTPSRSPTGAPSLAAWCSNVSIGPHWPGPTAGQACRQQSKVGCCRAGVGRCQRLQGAGPRSYPERRARGVRRRQVVRL